MRATGAIYEERASGALQRAGLRLLARSYTTRFGELDLVMLDDNVVVFVEVRHRKHGASAATVTLSKQQKLICAAELWLAAHPKYTRNPCRFDVVTYDGPDEQAHLDWLRAAFETH